MKCEDCRHWKHFDTLDKVDKWFYHGSCEITTQCLPTISTPRVATLPAIQSEWPAYLATHEDHLCLLWEARHDT